MVVGSGTIGVLAAVAAKALGGEVYISDVQAPKLEYVQKQFGFAGTIFDDSPEHFTEAVSEITGTYEVNGNVQPNGFDVCIEAVGLPSTFQNTVDAAAFGGKVVLIGVGKKNLDFNFTLLQKKETECFWKQKRSEERLYRTDRSGKRRKGRSGKSDHKCISF